MAEEPRKPFKTISLVDRLKGSQYDKASSGTPKEGIVQGSPIISPSKQPADKNSDHINLPKSQLTTDKEGAVLKGRLPLIDKEAIILKSLVKSPQAQLEPPRQFRTNQLINSPTPLARTQFANTIKLEDRLEQRLVTNTTHLPKYFLTDLYTGYLVISPFTTPLIEATQTIGPLRYPTLAEDTIDRQDPRTNIPEPLTEGIILLSQGTLFINETFISAIRIEDAVDVDTITLRQGTFITNNQELSFTETTDPVQDILPQQGSIEVTEYDTTPTQGTELSLSAQLDVNQMAVLQGMILSQGIPSVSVLDITENPPTLVLENSPRPTILLAQYETDRLLAIGAPKVKHGSADLQLSVHEADKLKALESPLLKHGSVELSVQAFLESRTQAINVPQAVHGEVAITLFETPVNDKQNQSPAVDENFESPGIEDSQNTPNIDPNQVFDPIKSGPIANALGPGGDASAFAAAIPFPSGQGTTQGSLSAYNAVAYGQLNKSSGKGKWKSSEDSDKFGIAKNTTAPAGVTTSKQDGDLITIAIKNVVSGKNFYFRSYLQSFSDSFTANWNDVQYVGRQDTLKQFTGATRAVSFDLLVPAFTTGQAKANLNLINGVVANTVMAGFGASSTYLVGPLCKLTIGGMFTDIFCVFDSVKVDFDPADATFDIDDELPHVFKLGFSCAILGDVKGKLLNGKTAQLYGK